MLTMKRTCGIVCLTIGSFFTLKKLWQLFIFPNPKKDLEKEKISKVLFFPDKVQACTKYFMEMNGCLNLSCKFSHNPETSTAHLLKFLKTCSRSMDICIFVFTCNTLANIIIDLHKIGRKIRVISDGGQPLTNSQIARFRKEGIEVRTNKYFLMHHKFVLIDNSTLINGSFNWTVNAAVGNHENLFITNDEYIVESYFGEFSKLWSQFAPELK